MILSQIAAYIEKRGQASLADIALHFDADPDAIRGMLDVWVRKGRIVRLDSQAGCGTSCTQCDSNATEVYAWGARPVDCAPPAICGVKFSSVEKDADKE